MKKVLMTAILSAMILVTNAESLSCQDTHTISAKPFIGVTFAKVLGVEGGTNIRTGFTGGVEGQYMANDWFAISAGIGYEQQGAQYNGVLGYEVKMTTKLDYVNIPVLANFYVCQGLALKVGIQPGFRVNTNFSLVGNNGEEELIPSSIMDPDKISKFDFAIPVGISYEYEQVVVEARANIGALNVIKNKELQQQNGNKTATNTVIQFTAGYRF